MKLKYMNKNRSIYTLKPNTKVYFSIYYLFAAHSLLFPQIPAQTSSFLPYWLFQSIWLYSEYYFLNKQTHLPIFCILSAFIIINEWRSFGNDVNNATQILFIEKRSAQILNAAHFSPFPLVMLTKTGQSWPTVSLLLIFHKLSIQLLKIRKQEGQIRQISNDKISSLQKWLIFTVSSSSLGNEEPRQRELQAEWDQDFETQI